MTGQQGGRRPDARAVQAAAITTWAYAAGFGIPAVPVAVYLLATGRLPTFLGLFPMYGGPWSSRLGAGSFVALLGAFLVPTGVSAWSAWWVWRRRRAGAVLNLAVLPLETLFWVGFALPLPWLGGLARIALLAAGWRSLDGSRSPAPGRPVPRSGAGEDVPERV